MEPNAIETPVAVYEGTLQDCVNLQLALSAEGIPVHVGTVGPRAYSPVVYSARLSHKA